MKGRLTIKKIKELDILSGIAIIMVVLIHADRFYVRTVLNLDSYLNAGIGVNILDNLIWAAVPIFIFISGYKYYLNIISTNQNCFYFIKKQLSKILPLFLLISFIFICLNSFKLLFVQNIPLVNVLIQASISFLKIFFGYNIAYQLWYIPLYFFIIILYPLIKKIVPNDLIRFILLAILSITVICLGLLSYPIKFFYYLIFFELGVQFSKYQFHHRISLLLNLCIVIAVVFTCTINKIPSIDTFLKHLILNPVMVIFYWKLSFLVSNNSILLKLGKYSFYIFLFHEPIIVRGISELINSTVVYSSFAYVFMVTGLSIIVTLLYVKIYLYGKSKRVIIWIKKATNSVN